MTVVHKFFSGKIPTVSEYAKETGVSYSTFSRAGECLSKMLPGFFRNRHPGPSTSKKKKESNAEQDKALQKLRDLRLWYESRFKTPKNKTYDGDVKKRIAQLSEEIATSHTLSYEMIANALGMESRQLYRIRQEVKESGGRPPEKKSRRPKNIKQLATELQTLIWKIEDSAPTNRPYRPTDVKRILEKNYKENLKHYKGSKKISLTTISKYMKKKRKSIRRITHVAALLIPKHFNK